MIWIQFWTRLQSCMFCVFSPVWDQLSADSMSVARPPLFWLYFEIWIKMALYCKRAIFLKISFSDVGWSPESRQRMLGKVAAVMTGGLEDLPGLQLLLLQLHSPRVANLPQLWLGENGKGLEENRILYFINDSSREFHSCNIEDKGRQWTLTEDGYINRFCNPPDPQRESWWMTTCDNASLTRVQK